MTAGCLGGAAALMLALAGCAGSGIDPDITHAIEISANGQPRKADALRTLSDEGVIKTPGEVGKMAMVLDLSCAFMGFPGATQNSPETVQRKFAQAWQINLTIEQTQQIQVVQKEFCG